MDCYFAGKYFQMSSFGEPHAFKYKNQSAVDFVQYNKRQLSRIYPAGKRIDSSNYDPVDMWNAGCQIGKYKPKILCSLNKTIKKLDLNCVVYLVYFMCNRFCLQLR